MKYEKYLGPILLLTFSFLGIFSLSYVMLLSSLSLGFIFSLFIVPQNENVWNRWLYRILISVIWTFVYWLIQVGLSKILGKDVSLLVFNFAPALLIVGVVEYLYIEDSQRRPFAKTLILFALFLFVCVNSEMFLRGASWANNLWLSGFGTLGLFCGFLFSLSFLLNSLFKIFNKKMQNEDLLSFLQKWVSKLSLKKTRISLFSLIIFSFSAISLTLVYQDLKEKKDLENTDTAFRSVGSSIPIFVKDFPELAKDFNSRCIDFNGVHYSKLIYNFRDRDCAWVYEPTKFLHEVTSFLKGEKLSEIKKTISEKHNAYDKYYNPYLNRFEAFARVLEVGGFNVDPFRDAFKEEGCKYVLLAPSGTSLSQLYALLKLNSNKEGYLIRLLLNMGVGNYKLFDFLPLSYQTSCIVTVGVLRNWFGNDFDAKGRYEYLTNNVLKTANLSLTKNSSMIVRDFLCASHLSNFFLSHEARTNPDFKSTVNDMVGNCAQSGFRWELDILRNAEGIVRDEKENQ